MGRVLRSGRPLGLACREVVELVTDLLEGALAPSVRARVEEHLRSCRNCAAYLEQMRVTVRAARRMAAAPLERREREALRTLYRAWSA